MSEPIFDTTTERMYARLPDVLRYSDRTQDYALKRYLSGLGDIQSAVDRLIARFAYLSPDERPDGHKEYEPFTQYTKRIRGNVVRTFKNLIKNPIPGSTALFSASRVTLGRTKDLWLRATTYMVDGAQYLYPANEAGGGENTRFPMVAGRYVGARVLVRNPNNYIIRTRLSLAPYNWNGTTWVSGTGSTASPYLTLQPGEVRVLEVSRTTPWGATDGQRLLPIVYIHGASTSDAPMGALLDVKSWNLFCEATPLPSSLPDVNGSLPNNIGQTFSWDGPVNNSTSTMTQYDTPTVQIDGRSTDLVDGTFADAEWLPWLTQLVGVDIETLASEEEIRNAISTGSGGFRAGSRDAIIDAVKSELTGTKYVQVFQNSNATAPIGTASMWNLLILTKYSETPSFAQIVETVIRKQAKPAGVLLFHRTFEAEWEDVETVYPTWAHWEAPGVTWTKIEETGLA